MSETIIYNGGLPDGTVSDGGREFRFTKGQPVEVPAETAERLLAQGDWIRPEKQSTKKGGVK